MGLIREVLEDEKTQDILTQMGNLKSVNRISDEDVESDPKEKPKNPNRQGLIRKVKNAHLVYKRENDTDSFDELWVYKSGRNGIKSEIDIKNDIISGTDIPVGGVISADGEQSYEIWHVSNIVFLLVKNLPN